MVIRMFPPVEGVAVHNGRSILSQTFAYRKSQAWDIAICGFDDIYDAGGDFMHGPDEEHMIPARPFGIVGRGEYPRQGKRNQKIAWLRRRGCGIVSVNIVCGCEG